MNYIFFYHIITAEGKYLVKPFFLELSSCKRQFFEVLGWPYDHQNKFVGVYESSAAVYEERPSEMSSLWKAIKKATITDV